MAIIATKRMTETSVIQKLCTVTGQLASLQNGSTNQPHIHFILTWVSALKFAYSIRFYVFIINHTQKNIQRLRSVW